jgi:hemolysin III
MPRQKECDPMGLSKKQTLGEEIANAISHGVAALFGIAGMILLLIKSSSGGEVASSILFGFGMIVLYTMSCLYHSFRTGSTVKSIFKRFDHIAIYFLIGGTFAPIFILVVDKPLGWYLLIGQWIIILLGTVFKAVFIRRFAVIHLMLYLLLGWSGLPLFGSLTRYSMGAFAFILAGGIAYTIGVLFYAFRWFKFSHFVWHLLVFLGSLFHFIAIYFYVF